MVNEVKPSQYAKAPDPILVTELGIVTEVRSSHPEKVLSSMLFIEFGMLTDDI